MSATTLGHPVTLNPKGFAGRLDIGRRAQSSLLNCCGLIRSPPAEIDVFGSFEDHELKDVSVRRNIATVRANNFYAKGMVPTVAGDCVGTGSRLQLLTDCS